MTRRPWRIVSAGEMAELGAEARRRTAARYAERVKGTPRADTVRLRMTPKEAWRIELCAAELGITTSEVIRRALADFYVRVGIAADP